MSKLITRIKRLALALCLATPFVSWADGMEFTDPTYTPWDGVYGAAAWRGDGGNFEVSKVADIAADGTIGEPYAMTWDATVATSGRRFCSACNTSTLQGYVSPGMLLVYDQAGKTAAADATFSPLSFCGLWVKALADETTPYSVTGSGNRATEFGVAGVSSYFKFDKSFTVNRTGTTTFLGDATVEIAQEATFTAQANASYDVAVDSAATLKLKGAGTLAVTTMTVNGTLDLSAETVPTISGNVTLAGTIVLPEGTEVSPESPFVVCSGTLSGLNVTVKIGDAEAVEKSFTAENGAITSLADPIYEFSDNFPTEVPYGKTYTFVGGETAETAVTVPSTVRVGGTLKTSGFITVPYYAATVGATLDVVDGTTTLICGNKALASYLTVEAGATLVNGNSDAVDYGDRFNANIYGTLDMGDTRWSLGSNNTINLYEGCTVTGSGSNSGNSALDWIENATATLNVYGDVSLAAPIRLRSGATVNVNVDTTDQKGLTLAGTIGSGKIVKKGAGLLKFTTNPPYAITVENGAFTFAVDATPTITYSAKPGTGTTMSMWYATQATWKGTVVLGVLDAPAALPLNSYGNANSKVVMKGTTGSCYLSADTINPELVIDTDEDHVVEFNNGSSGQVVNFTKISGTGTLKLVGWSGCSSATYNLNTIDGFTGTLAVHNAITRGGGGTLTIGIGNIVTTGATTPGSNVLNLSQTEVSGKTGTVVYNLANATLNGEAADLEVKEDGIYVVVPTVTVTVPEVDNTTVTVVVGEETIGTAAGNYDVAPGSVVTVTYVVNDAYEHTSGELVYNIDTASETTCEPDIVTTQYVARARNNTTKQNDSFTSLAAALSAISAGTHNPMVTLLANVSEPEVTVSSAIIIMGNYTINADIKIVDGGQLQLMQVTLAGKLTIEEDGIYATGGGTLSELVTKDGAKIQLTTLSDTVAPLAVTTLSVEGNLTIISSWGSAVRGTYYKAISYVTANADIAEGATVGSVNEWSAKVEAEGDNTVVYLAITKIAVVDGVYYDDAQDAVDAAVESGKQVSFLVAPGTVKLGDGETLVVSGSMLPTVVLDDGLEAPYEVEHTVDAVNVLNIYTVVKYVAKVKNPVYGTTAWQPEVKYTSLADAVAAVIENNQVGYDAGYVPLVTLLDNVTLDARVEPTKSMTIDLGGCTVTTTATCGNGSAFDVKSGNVTIKNGTIIGVEQLEIDEQTGNEKKETDAITARAGANVTLEDLTVTVNSQNGACVYPFANNDGETVTIATVTIKSGTYSNTTTKPYQYKTGWTGMAVNQANKTTSNNNNTGGVATQMVFIEGGNFSQLNPALGDDSWTDGEGSFVAAGKKAYEDTPGVWTVQNLKVFTVTFDSNGGTEVEAQNVTDGAKAATPEAPTKADNTFAGWTLNSEAYDFDTPVTAAITLVATWTPVQSGIDPTDPTSTQEVTVDTTKTEAEQKADAEAQGSVQLLITDTTAIAAMDAIAAADPELADAQAVYNSYFKYTAAKGATEGAWEVTAEIAPAVEAEVDNSAVAALEGNTFKTATEGNEVEIGLTVKPGLYYGVVCGTSLGTLGSAPVALELATATSKTFTVTKPTGSGTACFIKVVVSATGNAD